MQPNIEDQGAWINLCLGRDSERELKPTLNTLFCFNQATMEQVLEYLVQFVETEKRIDYNIGQWIYTLLAILEQPLDPDVCSCLRSLARACSIIRADSVIFFVPSTYNQSFDMLVINRTNVILYFRKSSFTILVSFLLIRVQFRAREMHIV